MEGNPRDGGITLEISYANGSPNIMLLRRRINGENLEGTITTTDVVGYVYSPMEAGAVRSTANSLRRLPRTQHD